MKVKRTLVQAQADAEEEQKAAAKRKRLAEDGLDEPVTKKVNPFYIFLQIIIDFEFSFCKIEINIKIIIIFTFNRFKQNTIIS